MSVYASDKHGFKEGSLDYLTVLGFEMGKTEFLYCFGTVTRQAVTKYAYESINFQTVPKSIGFYNKKSQSIITCGSHSDEHYKCHSHSSKTSVGFSNKLLPVDSAIVHVEDEVWSLGGRERFIPEDGPLMEPASFKNVFSRSIIILKTLSLSQDFVDSIDHRLPFPLAYHCAVYMKETKQLFVHGGSLNANDQFNGVLLYNINNRKWKIINEENPCGSLLQYETTQCEMYDDQIIVVPLANARNESCTALFGINSQSWIKSITKDGRDGLFGGVLIKTKGKLLYLGGSRNRYRSYDKDRARTLSDQESVQSGLHYLWHYDGLNEPWMKKIYEFNGHSWHVWSNTLPLPVYNTLVVPISDHQICENKRPKLMKDKDLKLRHTLKPDRSFFLNSFSRCGGIEYENDYFLDYRIIWENSIISRAPLDNLICFSEEPWYIADDTYDFHKANEKCKVKIVNNCKYSGRRL